MTEDWMIEWTLIMLAVWAAVGVAGFLIDRIIMLKRTELVFAIRDVENVYPLLYMTDKEFRQAIAYLGTEGYQQKFGDIILHVWER